MAGKSKKHNVKAKNVKDMQKKLGLSLCMIARDEEELIAKTLASVKGLVDEIIVVDTGSVDRTIEIAREFGARIINYAWNDDFSAARNAGLEEASGRWILFLDADEELIEDAAAVIRSAVTRADDQVEAFMLTVMNLRGESESSAYEETFPSVRIFRNKPDHRFTGALHEQITLDETKDGSIAVIGARLKHIGYLDPLVEARQKRQRTEALLAESGWDDDFNTFLVANEEMTNKAYGSALKKYLELYEKWADQDLVHVPGTVLKIICCCRELKMPAEALSWVGVGLERWPDYTDLEYLRALTYFEKGEFHPALEAFLAALLTGEVPAHYETQAGVGSWRAWQGIGLCFRELRRLNLAVAAFQEALLLNNEDEISVENLAKLLIMFGNDPQVVKDEMTKVANTDAPKIQKVFEAIFNAPTPF